jgi:hypothetical protein
VHGVLLAAAVQPDNTPHGSNLTMAFPVLVFVIVAAALYLRFRSPHRVPGHVALASSRWAEARQAAVTVADPAAVTDPEDQAGTAQAGQAAPADEGTEDGE